MKTVESAGVIVLASIDDSLCVAMTRESKSAPGVWSVPKGHIKPGESEIAAARREVMEEVGLDSYFILTKLGIITRESTEDDGTRVNKKIHMFLGWCTNAATLEPTDSNNPDASWIKVAHAATVIPNEKDKAAFSQWLAPILDSL